MIADSFDVIPKGYCGYVLEGGIFDGAKALRLGLNTDADKAAGVEDVKSTSGISSHWKVQILSGQGATASSTCEAEMISLESEVFGEGLPMQELFETTLNRPIDLICQQDNASVIQIVHGR